MAQDSPSIDFLYDFLYVDKLRVNSWFAQLFNEGVLTSFKRTNNASEQRNNGISGGVPGVAKAGLTVSDTLQEGHERNYSAEWSLPLTLLDALDENNYIHRNIQFAEIGSLVLVSGSVQLTDAKMLQKMWAPATKIVTSTNKITNKNRAEMTQLKNMFSTFGDIVSAMPLEAQIYLKDRSGEIIWASLKDENMIVNASTLALTHGSKVQGTWHVLAALDAKPSLFDESVDDELFGDNELNEATASILDQVRALVGRSSNAYAVTPILIFRQTSPFSRED